MNHPDFNWDAYETRPGPPVWRHAVLKLAWLGVAVLFTLLVYELGVPLPWLIVTALLVGWLAGGLPARD